MGMVQSHKDIGGNTWKSTCSHLLSLQRARVASASASEDDVRKETSEHDPSRGLGREEHVCPAAITVF